MVESEDARRMYSMRIIELWLECIDVSHQAQKFFLRDEPENEITLEYVARLTRLWKELKPKVLHRSELKDLESKYMSFEVYAIQPRELLSQADKIYELEEVICEVLDKLQLTVLDSIK